MPNQLHYSQRLQDVLVCRLIATAPPPTNRAPTDLQMLHQETRTNLVPKDWSLAAPITAGLHLFPVRAIVGVTAAEAIAVDDSANRRCDGAARGRR